MENRNETDGLQRSNDYLDFMLGKICETYFETGKTISNAFLTYLTLLSVEILLVFGMEGDERVAVPLLQVTLKRSVAAIVVLVLSCLALYWFLSLRSIYSYHLRNKFYELLRERYGQPIEPLWNHIQYPTPLWVIAPLIKTTKNRDYSTSCSSTLLSLIFVVALGICNFVLPFVFAWRIGNILRLSGSQKIVSFVVVFLLIAPAITALRSSPSVGELIDLDESP